MSVFHFNTVIVIQSLEPEESQTGTHLAEYIGKEVDKLGLNIPVRLVNCDSAKEFKEILAQVEHDAVNGLRPIIHIECHGDEETGLNFSNNSDLSWEELSKGLIRVNIASNFNLVTVVSACYGAYFSTYMTPLATAPSYALLSPSSTITPYEIKIGLEGFYREFLKNPNVSGAVSFLKGQKLMDGGWFVLSAEQWFESTLFSYIEERCSRRSSIQRANHLNAEWRSRGAPMKSQNEIFSLLRERHRNIDREAFRIFFAVADIPENASRFSSTFERVKSKVARIRAKGTHII